MHELTPSEAAKIASGVYLLRENTVSQLRARQEPIGCEGMFTVDDGSRFQGRSGALAWKSLSGFGYIAAGEGAYAGEVLIATRGTKTGLDWLSNLNVAMQLGPGSLPVHAGFNEIWKTIAPEIKAFMNNRNPSRIHCVGHSLGGALATLNADLLSAVGAADVMLYTFGCPRTGDGFFARGLTRRLGAGHVHRVYHPADPVPMIPVFPFWHAPTGVGAVSIENTLDASVTPSAHGMAKSYVPGVEDFTWQSLDAAAAQRADEERQVKNWLERAAEGQSMFVQGSVRLLSMIGRALGWLLKKAGKLLVATIGTALTVGMTVLDQLAWVLAQGAQLSRELGGHVKTLVGAILRFLGRVATQVADVTVAFVRWVLGLLHTSLRTAAERALALIGA